MSAREFEERMLTTEQVAKWLGIAPRTVCTWAECNQLPAVKVGRQWRFHRQELLDWFDQSKVNNASAAPAAAAAGAAYTFQRTRL